MSKVAVVYWSGTGNTANMAMAVAEGAKAKGAEVEVLTPLEFASNMIEKFDGIAFGCPSMGAEQLEEVEFEPMFNDCVSKLAGKKIALFGSYGWGDGEWMRNWEADCQNAGITLVHESVILAGSPDTEGEAACQALGAAVAG